MYDIMLYTLMVDGWYTGYRCNTYEYVDIWTRQHVNNDSLLLGTDMIVRTHSPLLLLSGWQITRDLASILYYSDKPVLPTSETITLPIYLCSYVVPIPKIRSPISNNCLGNDEATVLRQMLHIVIDFTKLYRVYEPLGEISTKENLAINKMFF